MLSISLPAFHFVVVTLRNDFEKKRAIQENTKKYRKATPNTRKHQKPPKRKATKERNRGSEVAGDGYGHVAARWWATGKGARKRGGGQWVRARGSAVADNGYGREAVQWRVTSTGATQRGGGRRVRERGSARQSGRG